MSHKSKKAAPEATSEESVTTKSAESQEQPTTTPDGSTTGGDPVVAGAGATTTESQSITVTNQISEVLQRSAISPEEKQYLDAIGMKDDQLGELIKKPTERINKWFGSAVAHETQAKEERRLAQKEFNANLAYYYEVKQRLLNPKYRPDLNTGHERTEEDNLKNFGAKDWQEFNQKCTAYSLQHADRKPLGEGLDSRLTVARNRCTSPAIVGLRNSSKTSPQGLLHELLHNRFSEPPKTHQNRCKVIYISQQHTQGWVIS